jgi:uncharacterized membrane protein HdeD (DUF308 family)
MSDPQGGGYGPRDEQGPRPEVVTTTVVVTDAGADSRGRWGIPFAMGIVAVIFGIVVLFNIWGSLRLVAILAGLFLIFAGIMQLVTAGRAQRRGGRLAAGIITLILGLVLVFWPESSLKTVAVLVGLAFLIWGVAMAVAALMGRGEGWGVVAGFGAVLAIIGIVIMAWPGPTIAILMALVGLTAIVFGISAMAQGLALRRT